MQPTNFKSLVSLWSASPVAWSTVAFFSSLKKEMIIIPRYGNFFVQLSQCVCIGSCIYASLSKVEVRTNSLKRRAYHSTSNNIEKPKKRTTSLNRLKATEWTLYVNLKPFPSSKTTDENESPEKISKTKPTTICRHFFIHFDEELNLAA